MMEGILGKMFATSFIIFIVLFFLSPGGKVIEELPKDGFRTGMVIFFGGGMILSLITMIVTLIIAIWI